MSEITRILSAAEAFMPKPSTAVDRLVTGANDLAQMYEARACSIRQTADRMAGHLENIAKDLRRQAQQNAAILTRHEEQMAAYRERIIAPVHTDTTAEQTDND